MTGLRDDARLRETLPFPRIDEAAKLDRTVEGDVLPLPVLDVRRATKYITMSGHMPRARARTDL
jgi:hypothetical protein